VYTITVTPAIRASTIDNVWTAPIIDGTGPDAREVHDMKCRLLILAVVLASTAAHAAEPAKAKFALLTDLKPNRWTTVYDGPPGIIAAHARFVWLPDSQNGFLWPCYNYMSKASTVENYAKVHLYDAAAGKWSAVPTTFPKGWLTGRGVIAKSYVYLPGLKRLLFLWGGSAKRQRKDCNSWLLDPKTWAWESLLKQPRMSDTSKDFNPSRGTEGTSMPLWGVLVYDAHNKEAVSIGGGGTWGRVGKKPEPVEVGDWIYDELGTPKRTRRLMSRELDKDGKLKITEARKWYPANCGTWVFSEKDKLWRAIEQPLAQQPPGRLLVDAVYVPTAKKIVLFGGDNSQKCFRDTWVYDCETRTWAKLTPKLAPPPRAGHAMVYLPDQDVVLLAGGYGPGWAPLKDVWVYSVGKNEWSKLTLDLPVASRWLSADYDSESKVALLSLSLPSWGKNRTTKLLGLRLDLKAAKLAKVAPPVDPKLEYHCKHKVWPAPLPEEWDSARNKPGDPDAGRRKLAALPANTWMHSKPPMKVRARQWGKYVYDRRTHKAYAWGGGHYGYIGAEMSEYDLLTNRWRSMNDPVNYKLYWRHGSAGGSPGVSFQGWPLMGTHARKTYHVDPISNSVITLHGDVYDIAEQRYVTCIGRRPGGWGLSGQHADTTTPHGLYSFAASRASRKGELYRANVAAGKWDLIATGGPNRHHEYDTLCYDTKRDRLIYATSKNATIWAFDFKTKKWSTEKPAGPAPKTVQGDPGYVDDLDAMMWVFGMKGRTPAPKMLFYKLAERKWYTAPYKGAVVGKYFSNLNNSVDYDPKLKVCIRMSQIDRAKYVEIGVMRLDVKTLILTPLKD
jgi:galactose oxidase-like protein